jgi:hypothetical protein
MLRRTSVQQSQIRTANGAAHAGIRIKSCIFNVAPPQSFVVVRSWYPTARRIARAAREIFVCGSTRARNASHWSRTHDRSTTARQHSIMRAPEPVVAGGRPVSLGQFARAAAGSRTPLPVVRRVGPHRHEREATETECIPQLKGTRTRCRRTVALLRSSTSVACAHCAHRSHRRRRADRPPSRLGPGRRHRTVTVTISCRLSAPRIG